MARNVVDWIALILVIIGGLNWGIMGISSTTNIVGSIFGSISSIVYILVGLSAIWMLIRAFKE